MGVVRFPVLDADIETRVARFEMLGDNDFDSRGQRAQRCRSRRRSPCAARPRQPQAASSGWDSLTPAELDVVKLVCEGLGNKDIAARLFVSPRTVQAHLTHVQLPVVRDALERVHATVREADAGTDHQVLHRPSGEELVRSRMVAYTSRNHDAEAGDVIAAQLDLSGVEPGPDV